MIIYKINSRFLQDFFHRVENFSSHSAIAKRNSATAEHLLAIAERRPAIADYRSATAE
jgi:hypothetical protein